MESGSKEAMESLSHVADVFCSELNQALDARVRIEAIEEYKQGDDFSAAGFRYISAVRVLQNCFEAKELDRTLIIDQLGALDGHKAFIQKEKQSLKEKVWPSLQEYLEHFGFRLKFPEKGFGTRKAIAMAMYMAFRNVLEPWSNKSPILDFIQRVEWDDNIPYDADLADRVKTKVEYRYHECLEAGITTVGHLRKRRLQFDAHAALPQQSSDVDALAHSEYLEPELEYINLADFKLFMLRFGPFPNLLFKGEEASSDYEENVAEKLDSIKTGLVQGQEEQKCGQDEIKQGEPKGACRDA